jgi:hypothetical protein
VGTQELRADAGRQAIELNTQSRALQEIIECSGLRLMVRRGDDSALDTSIAPTTIAIAEPRAISVSPWRAERARQRETA